MWQLNAKQSIALKVSFINTENYELWKTYVRHFHLLNYIHFLFSIFDILKSYAQT